MPFFSVIIPVYNRPEELEELLTSLSSQSYQDFEVVVVEDGSTVTCKHVVDLFGKDFDIRYYVIENSGQGFARNHGFKQAAGRYLIVFDSDCIIPPHYFQSVYDFLKEHQVDAFGGPDRAHPSFTLVQKTISHVMTSFLTTGGIRGNKKHIGDYHPRSFNMGMSREVFERTQGYKIPYMGEDIEFSIRLLKLGYKAALIPDAYVYHKRRTDLSRFYKQLKYFGRARINISRFFPGQIKLTHLFPLFFTLGWILIPLYFFLIPQLGYLASVVYLIYFVSIALEGLLKYKNFGIFVLSPVFVVAQFLGYGYGMCYEWLRKLRGIDPNTKYIELY
jgi:glycosyltransferase involved in cell wall biosynthesis